MEQLMGLVTSFINLIIAIVNYRTMRELKKMKDADRGNGLHRWKN